MDASEKTRGSKHKKNKSGMKRSNKKNATAKENALNSLDARLKFSELDSKIYLSERLSENSAIVLVTKRLEKKCACKRYCQDCKQIAEPILSDVNLSSSAPPPPKKIYTYRKPPLDQGKNTKLASTSKLKRKKSDSSINSGTDHSFHASTSSLSPLLDSSHLDISIEESINFTSSISTKVDIKHSHCPNCQCLLTAFEDESITAVARLLVDVRSAYFMKTEKEVTEMQYQLFRESVIRYDELSAQNDEPVQSFSYNFAIPDSYGGGTLCRENWLWIYDISDHKSRKFVKRLKDSLNNYDPMSKFESFKDNLTEFSDKTYLGLPYGEVKALFEETLGFAGFNRH